MSLDNGFDWTKERLKPFLGYPSELVTENFLLVGSYQNKSEAINVIKYDKTIKNFENPEDHILAFPLFIRSYLTMLLKVSFAILHLFFRLYEGRYTL